MTLSASQQLTWLEELEALAAAHPAPASFAAAVNLRWRERFPGGELALIALLGEPTAATAATAPERGQSPQGLEGVVARVRQSREEWRTRSFGAYEAWGLFFRQRRVGALVLGPELQRDPAALARLRFLTTPCARLLASLGPGGDSITRSGQGPVIRPARAKDASPAPPFEATPFGKYLLLDRIAEGGMAEILLARTVAWGGVSRLCVVKRILPELGRNARFVSRFIDEARLTVDLDHENVVRLMDFGQVDGSYFMAMELVRGTDVAHLARCFARAGRLPPPSVAVYVGMCVARALAYAHDRRDPAGRRLGIVHRDVTPHNVLLDDGGAVKLADFGVALSRHMLTADMPGTVVGKYSYMSPEQTRGEPLDARCDLWALGVIMHELLTARRLFRHDSTEQIFEAVRAQQIAPPSADNPAVSGVLDDIVMGMLERELEQRTSSAATLALALEDLLEADRFGREDLLREADSVGWAPHPVLRAFDDDTDAGVHLVPAAVELPAALREDEAVARCFAELRRAPDLWRLVELGERFLALGHGDWGLAAIRCAATLFAYQGLFVQTVCVAHLARPLIGDAVVNQEILSLLRLPRDARDSWRACLRQFDAVGLCAMLPELGRLLEGDAGALAGAQAPLTLNPLFELLSSEETAQLFKLATLERVAAGAHVVTQGEPGDAIFAVGRGRLVVYCEQQPERLFLSALSDGDLFGEISFLSARPRTATIEAVSDALVLKFDRAAAGAFFERHIEVSDRLREAYRARLGALLLARNPIFASLSVPAGHDLLLHATGIEARDGEQIVSEGEAGTDFFLIIEGEVEVFRVVDGIELFINKLGSGDFFGERAALTGEARGASVRAMGNVELLRITRDQVERFLSDRPAARGLIEAAMEVRRIDAEGQLAALQHTLAGL